MKNTKIIIISVIAVLLFSNTIFLLQYFKVKKELTQANQQIVTQQINQKIIIFANLFIDKILLGEGTVSFDDRLKLENAVRDINDPEMFSKWQDFTSSKGDKDAQKSVGNLLKVLFSKTN